MLQVRVIAVMDKERAAMQKLHKQYQKERVDQESLEGEYGERMRRVNEDLRVVKVPLPLLYLMLCCFTRGRVRRAHAPRERGPPRCRGATALLMLYCFTHCFTHALLSHSSDYFRCYCVAFAHDLFAACSVTLLLLHLVRYCFTHAFLLY